MNFRSVLVLTGVAFSGCTSEAKAQPSEQDCAPVEGTISAAVTRQSAQQTTVQGTVTGNLAGSVVARISQIVEGEDGVLQLTLAHDFVTDGGSVLSTTDTATLTPVPGQPNVFQQTTTYTIVSGTKRFQGATGQLTNHGETNLARGLLTLAYEGSVCGIAR
ncbi:MAG: hypothetical protein ABW217_12855 [Polyangiaceae bacterium]